MKALAKEPDKATANVQARIPCGWLLLFAVTLSFTGCGFQLRGAAAIPTDWQQLSLRASPNNAFTHALIEQLRLHQVKITETAPIQLIISKVDYDKRTVSFKGRNNSAEKEITQRIEFSLIDLNNNQVLLPKTSLQASRSYVFDDNQITAMKSQEADIRDELYDQLAISVLNRLQQQSQQVNP